MATSNKQESQMSSLMSELPIDRLRDEAIGLGKALAQRGIARLGESMTGATGKLGDLADAAPGPGDVVKAAGKVGSPMGAVKGAAKGAASKVADVLPGGSDDDSSGDDSSAAKSASGDNTDLKVTNIVESIDVPVSRDVAYGLWTQFEEFPSFMKKVETVQQKDPEVVTWKAQVFLSHRTWTSRIMDQVPPEHIVWKSEADKGRVDGAVTFHELAPDLTRVLVTLEYHPQGLFERVGNLWHAQGRRVRLELKHFRRHVANHALMNQGDVDGWEGEIHDGKAKPRRRTSSTAKKSTSGSSQGSNGGSSTARKTAATKSTSSSARKSAAKKSSTTKSAAKKAPASKSTAKRSPARKSTAKKSAASKRTSAASKRTSSTSARTSSGSNRGSAAKKSTRSSSRTRQTRSRS